MGAFIETGAAALQCLFDHRSPELFLIPALGDECGSCLKGEIDPFLHRILGFGLRPLALGCASLRPFSCLALLLQFANEVVVKNELITVAHQQVRRRIPDAHANNCLRIFSQLADQRRKIRIATDNDECVDVRLRVAKVERIDDHAYDVWITEHGPQGGDELNRIVRGGNYGWPVVGYGVNYRTGLAIHEGTMREGMESPTHFWVPSIATSGLMIYTGDRFPDWRGNIFAGGLAGQQVARLSMNDDSRQIEREETLVWGMGRIRDVRQGPDGYIYVAIEARGGAPTPVVRLEPVED